MDSGNFTCDEKEDKLGNIKSKLILQKILNYFNFLFLLKI